MDPRHSSAPIVSLLQDDTDSEERLDAFVARLGETVDAFQDAEAGGDIQGLQALSECLSAEARELGYPLLEEVARDMEMACRENSTAALRKSVESLTEVSQRIRRGHRSSA